MYLHRTLRDKYRVVPVAGDPTIFNHLKSEKGHGYSDGLYVSLGGFRKVSLLHTDVDLSDFFFANGGFKKAASRVVYEGLSYVTDDKELLNGDAFLQPPTPLPPSETQGSSSLEVLGKSFSNIPPRTRDYVPREELESELRELLRNNRHPIITLIGRGGIGKTSLALEVVHQAANAGDFLAIIWLSSRDIDLHPDGPKIVVPKVRTIEEVAAEYAALVSAAQPNSGFKPVEYLTAAMSNTSSSDGILFVFDNFETMHSPAEMYQLIDTYIRLPNKVLITSRQRDFKADYPVRVGGMRRSQFDELVRATAIKLDIIHLLAESYIEELFEESDGHPYVVKVILGEVARERKVGKVRRVIARHEGILDALFERTFSSVSPAARRVFLTLCNWKSMVPRLAVEGTLLRPSNERMDVEEAIETLEKSSMIEILRSAPDGQEFIQVPLVAQMFGARKLRVSAMQPEVDADTKVLRSFGAMQDVDVAKGLDPRIERMIGSLSERVQNGRSIDDGLAVLEYLAGQYPKTWLSIARLYSDAPDRRSQEKSLEFIERFLESNPDDLDGWKIYVTNSRHLKDYSREINGLFRIAELPGAGYSDLSVVANVLNRYLSERLLVVDGEERRVMIERAIRLMNSKISEASATDYSRLAWLHVNLGDMQKAQELTDKGLSLEPANSYCLSLARRIGSRTSSQTS